MTAAAIVRDLTNRYRSATLEEMPDSDWMLHVQWFKPQPAKGYREPHFEVTAFPPDSGYAVTVELQRDEEGAYITGVATRRHRLLGWDGKRTHVPPRDVQRLPLSRIVRAALAHVNGLPAEPPAEPVSPEGMPEPRPLDSDVIWQRIYYGVGTSNPRWLRAHGNEPGDLITTGKILVPRGRPKPRHSSKFYCDLSKSYRDLALRGGSPVKEIAKRMRVPENTVHQWVHRARKLGFLEPAPRTEKTDTNG